MRAHNTLTLLCALCFASAASADLPKGDLIKLGQAKIDESIILKYIEASGPVEPLSAQDLVDLKASGVSDRVLAAAVESAGRRAAPVVPAPPEHHALPPVVSAPSALPPAPSAFGQGSVQMENQDIRDYHVVVDESSRTVLVYDQGGSGRWLVSKRAPLSLTLAEGTWRIQWTGEANHGSFGVRPGGDTRVRLASISGTTYRALTVRVIEDGQEKSSGALKIFEDAPPAPAPVAVAPPAPAPAPVQYQPVQTVVVPDTRYVYLNPSPVYVGVSHTHYAGCGHYGFVSVEHSHYSGCGHRGYEVIHSHYDGCGHYGYRTYYGSSSCGRSYSYYDSPSVRFSYGRSRWGGHSGSWWGFSIGF